MIVEYGITFHKTKPIDMSGSAEAACLHSDYQGFKTAASNSLVLHSLYGLYAILIWHQPAVCCGALELSEACV